MHCKIKTFEDEIDHPDHGTHKLVGFLITETFNGRTEALAVDKRLTIVEGKTDEQYLTEAHALCDDDIARWSKVYDTVGRAWNPDTNVIE